MKINKWCILFVSLCSFANPNVVEPLSDETEQEISTLNKSFPTQLEDLEDAKETPILSNPSKLEIIITHKKTSDFPRSVRTILFSKAPKDGKIRVTSSSSGLADRLHDQIKNRRSGTIFFKNVKNQTDNFCVEFIFSKTHTSCLSIIIYYNNQLLPTQIVEFVKTFTTAQPPISKKTMFLVPALLASGLFLFTNNQYKRMARAKTFLLYRKCRAQFAKRFIPMPGSTPAQIIKQFFEEKGSKKQLFTTQDLWGTTDLAGVEDFFTSGKRWVGEKEEPAAPRRNRYNYRYPQAPTRMATADEQGILIVTITELLTHPKLLQFLTDNCEISHNETRSRESLATGTGYGTNYSRNPTQSIKTGNRILIINDNTTACDPRFKDKSGIKLGTADSLYGKIDSRLWGEIETDLCSDLYSDNLKQINKFFDLGATLI
ncbi:hypothetical protein FJ366_01680 [Candidatus Dependentiae bacterium]|nr:hypothetical protein [Candidatus Dependentiae bacterium]